MALDTLRYLKFDFQSHRDALLQRVRARWPLVWNDFLNNSFGMVLVDLVAWSTATVAFLINRVAGEMYVSTMTLRESAVRLGANYGYQLRGPVPAVVSCEAALTSPQTALVTILAGTMVRTADSKALPFETVQEYTIQPGDLSPMEIVISIAPGLSGPKSIATLCNVVSDSAFVDLADSSINLANYAQVGQVFRVDGSTVDYTIQSVEAAPNAVSNNRLVLTSSYAGVSGLVQATVYDKRVQFVQGQTVSDRYVSPAQARPNFVVKLSRTPVISNLADVVVNNEAWSQVTSLAGAAATDMVYAVKTFTTGETLIQFGDNVFGTQIPTEANIEVTYRVGGGEAGNVDLNGINTSITGLIKSRSSPVTITLQNQTSAGQGGRDAETLEEARTNIPYFVRTNDRAVTLDDYQTVAQQFTDESFGSVAYARVVVRSENALLEGNVVSIYAWTTGVTGGLVPLSPQLKQLLKDFMQTKAVGTDYVQVLDGDARPVPISFRFRTRSGFSVTSTKLLVEQAVNDTINALRPGQPLIYSDLVRKLDSTYGVENLIMATPVSDLSPASNIELFTSVRADYAYALARNGIGALVYSVEDGVQIGLYQAQMPVYPIQAWSFRLFLGLNELTVVPGLESGTALLLGPNLSISHEQDSEKRYIYASTANLLTGAIYLWIVGSPGDLTMKLVPVIGFATERPVNIYIGYEGDNSQTKRREIRAALSAWSDGLAVGDTLYGVRVPGVLSSQSCITEVVAGVAGVDQVNRVALDVPGNTADRITALDGEQLAVGNVYCNNSID